MAESFLQLSANDKLDALGVASEKCKRPAHLLEKDVWVVWALRTMFESTFGPHLVFKGGTSLSKAYRVIRRFSEDVDLTYDIRKFAPDLVGADNEEALPSNGSQQKRWTKNIRERLARWLRESALPLVQQHVDTEGLPAKVGISSSDEHSLWIEYEHVAAGSGYVKPVVVLEFGARSTGEPCELRPVVCDAAEHLPTLVFPVSTPRVMKAERTFWEKATAVHVVCKGGKIRGSRFSRHWYDLVQLAASGHADAAMNQAQLAQQVARHKSMCFAEKSDSGEQVDYAAAVAGELQLVPTGTAHKTIEADYIQMVEDGLLLDAESPEFAAILDHCAAIQERVNRATKQTP